MSKSRTARRQRDDAAAPPPAADAGEAPPGHDISLGRLAHYIGFRMRRVHDIQTREFMRLTRDENLTQGMFTALALISANPGSSQVRLAQEMGLHTSAMVSLIDELEGRQWVTRQKSKLDRRRHQLVVAPAGEAALLRLLAVLEDVESQGLKALSGAELDVLTVALDKLYTAYRSLAADAAGKSADDTAEP